MTTSINEVGIPPIEKEFRKIQPILTELARGLTGKPKVKVVPNYKSSRTQTDGTIISLAPPSQLAVVTEHTRTQCGRRGDNFQMLCQECARRESILCMLMHEVGHITGHSFETMVGSGKALPPTPWLTDEQRLILDERWRRPYKHGIESALAFGPYIGSYFKVMLMGCEDIRIEAAISEIRPATEEMLLAAKMRVITAGTDHAQDGYQMAAWSTYPLNFQVVCALGFSIANVDIVQYMDPTVVAAVNDRHVKKINQAIPKVKSVSDLIRHIIPLYGRLIELGFFEGERKPEPPDNLGNPGGDSQPPSGEPEPTKSDDKSEPSTEPKKEENKPDDRDGDSGSKAGDSDSESPSGDKPDEQPPGDSGESSDSEHDPGDENTGEGAPESEDETAGAGDESSGGKTGPDQGDPTAEQAGSKSGDSGADSGEQESETEGMAESSSDGTGRETAGSSDVRATSEDTDPVGGDASDSTAQRGTGDITGPRSDEGEPVPSDPTGDPSGESTRTESSQGTQDLSNWSEWGEPEGEQGLADEVTERPKEEPTGVEATRARSGDQPVYGEVNEVEGLLAEFLHHDAQSGELDRDKFGQGMGDTLNPSEAQKIEIAANKAPEFDQGSPTAQGVIKFRFDSDSLSWRVFDRSDRILQSGRLIQPVIGRSTGRTTLDHERNLAGVMKGYLPSEAVLGQQLQRLKVIFQDNKRAKFQRNLKSGRINPATLGKRAAIGDPRLFRHKDIPGKRDYEVAIFLDCSGSTASGQMDVEKKAVMAQAELLSRLNIPFSITAHSGNRSLAEGGREMLFAVELYIVKTVDQPWNDTTKTHLAYLPSTGFNVDGHALQCALHQFRFSRATDKIIMYYTDGQMPNANYADELATLTRGLTEAKRSKITVMAVGVRTDSPKEYGLDTVIIEDGRDVHRVVDHLARRLAQ